jgi:hypothetical protein
MLRRLGVQPTFPENVNADPNPTFARAKKLKFNAAVQQTCIAFGYQLDSQSIFGYLSGALLTGSLD